MNILQTITQYIKPNKEVFAIEASSEKSRWRSSLYEESQWTKYNPDDLVQKKGLKIYRKMLKDEQVSACIEIKKNIIYGSGWKIEAAVDENKNEAINTQYKEHADFIDYCFTDGMKGSFRNNLREIMSAFPYGFSITEMILQVCQKGKYKGKIILKQLKTRPSDSFDMDRDDYGNLLSIEQDNGSIKITDDQLKYFVIYSYNSEYGNPFGQSDLRQAYRGWWSKDNIYKFRNIFLERFGMGIVIAKYPKGLGDNDRDVMKKMIDNIQVKSAFSIPKELEISILEAARRGEAGFHEAMDREDKAIAKAVLIPDKLGFTESEGGSYNLGENQFNLFFLLMDNIREDIAETVITEQCIRFLTDLNFPNVEKYPKFKFNPLTQKDKKAIATIVINAIDKNVIQETDKDEEWLREQLDMPQKEEGAVPRDRPKSVSPFGGKPGEEEEEKKPPVKFKLNRKPTIYEQKVDFAVIEKVRDEFDYDSSIKIGRIITKLKDELLGYISRKELVENKAYSEINDINLKFIGDLRLELKDILRKSFNMGHKDAKVEVKKKFSFAEGLLNLPPKEALKYFEQKAFWLSSVESDFIKKHTQAILLDAIKTGKDTDGTIFTLEEFFNQYKVEQLTSTGELALVSEIPGRVETIIRTNNNDAYNQGRMAMYRDPEVSDFVVAYQFSAIMDARTSDNCAELDGKIYKANDPIWDSITPPNHPNCRSTIVPILGDEEFEVSKHVAIELPEGFGK